MIALFPKAEGGGFRPHMYNYICIYTVWQVIGLWYVHVYAPLSAFQIIGLSYVYVYLN